TEPLAATQLALPRLRIPLPGGERKGPMPQAWEGEGAPPPSLAAHAESSQAGAMLLSFSHSASAGTLPPPPRAAARGPSLPPRGEEYEAAGGGDLPWQAKPPKRPSAPLPAATETDSVGAELAPLIDRLGGRLGLANIHRLAPVASH